MKLFDLNHTLNKSSRKYGLILFLATLCKMVCSQSVQEISIELCHFATEKAMPLPCVYIVSSDNTVLCSSCPYPDGKTFFRLSSSVELNGVYVAIRQKDESIYRLKLSLLMSCNKPIAFGDVQLKHIEIKTLDAMESEIPLIDRCSIRSFQNGYDSAFIESKYGPGHWYFPESKLVRSNLTHEDFVRQYVNVETYKSVFGHFPTEKELDSLIKLKEEQDAEELAGLYSDELAQLKEPVLCEGSNNDVYRFVWSHNLHHTYNPYCIRVESTKEGSFIMYCSYILFHPCDENQSYCDVIPLDENAFSQLLGIIEQSDFWNSKPINDNGGTNCILEANVKGKYHVIFRGEGEDPNLDELQRFLWSLTGLGENKIVHRRQRIE